MSNLVDHNTRYTKFNSRKIDEYLGTKYEWCGQLCGWKKMTWIGCMKDVLLLIIVSGDEMDNWLAKIVCDVDNLHVEIEK